MLRRKTVLPTSCEDDCGTRRRGWGAKSTAEWPFDVYRRALHSARASWTFRLCRTYTCFHESIGCIIHLQPHSVVPSGMICSANPIPVRIRSRRVEKVSARRNAAKLGSLQYEAWAVIMSATSGRRGAIHPPRYSLTPADGR